MREKDFDTLIIGAGITGLAAGYYAQKSGHVKVIEAAPRAGGKIRSEYVDVGLENPFLLEWGADSMLALKPEGSQLAGDLGIASELVPTRPARHIYMLRHGRLLAMPEGLQLVIPKRLWPFVKSPLFSWPGKLRMGLDLVLPKRSARGDESVASFMCRRLGQEALDLLAEPILSGIFSADPERQSLLATFPQLMDLERKHRSLILGALRTPPPPGPRPPSMFLSFRRGMQTLTDALASSLGENLLLNRAVKSIQRDSHGFIVGLGDSALTARRIILTASAKQSASLLTTVAPKAASLLAQMRYTSSGCAFLAYPKVNVKHSLEGYGILIPKVEKRMINAVTWVSSKIEGRAPASHALFRVFFGGERCPEMMERSDEEIVAIAQREVAELHGITGEPTLTRVFRSQQGNPQYDVGHLDRVKQIEGDLPPGLVVTGCGMRGVGIPDCIRQAKASI